MMLVKYTYPITGDVFMPEHWPISWDRYRVTWTVKDGKADSLTVAVRTTDLSGLPRIEQNPEPGFAGSIHIGHQAYHDEVESLVRTACGLLGFFAHADIDFDRPSIAWEGETPEECAKLQMSSFNVGPGEREEALPISYDLVVRCFLSALPASEREIPLSFLAKGRRDMLAGRYIDAYYSHYFFLETQFAPGYSNPNQVKARFNATSEIAGAMQEARRMAGPELRRVRRLADLLKLSDEKLIEHLVETRNRLHHHALRSKKGSWHPDKNKQFQAEALFLAFLANIVSRRQCMPLVFHEGINEQIEEATRKEGVAYTYVVEAEGGGDRYSLNGLPALPITLPALAPSHRGLAALEEELRREGAPYDRKAVRGYTIKSTDGSQVLACYQNHTFSEP
jgi:hypothetical protein